MNTRTAISTYSQMMVGYKKDFDDTDLVYK